MADSRHDEDACEPNNPIVIEVGAPDRLFLDRYRTIEKAGVAAPPQSSLWVEAWVDTSGTDKMAATALLGGPPVMALAFDVERNGPMRTARFMGGTHANGNFPLCDRDWLATASPPTCAAIVSEIARALGKARPDIDVMALERLLPDLEGLTNPLLSLPSHPSPNLSLAAGLDGKFDSFLSGSTGKRRRKKYRSRVRKYETAGGYRRVEARTEDDVRALLTAFYRMKAARFEKAGITNVFSPKHVERFFEALFVRALERGSSLPFVLHGLEVGGKLRAVTGSSRTRDSVICEFGSITEDELASASPGDFLFHENIREACESGFKVYDFSVGDEDYKRLWCDLETVHRDVVLPISAKGRLLALGMNAAADLKRRLKANPKVWQAAKRLRETINGRGYSKPPAAKETDD